MTRFLDRAEDVASFAKNQGPQSLRIDALTAEGRRSLYTADFLIRQTNGSYVLAETKGRRDPDVAGKARAAAEWCKAASTSKAKWEYLYVSEDIFKAFSGDSVAELLRTCRPTLKKLIEEATSPQMALPLGETDREDSSRVVYEFIAEEELGALPLRARKGIQEAALLLDYMATKQKVSFAPVFQPLLGPIDAAAEALLLDRLLDAVPSEKDEINDFFSPDLSGEKKKHRDFLANQSSLLRRFLINRSPIMPTGVLRFCLDYAEKDEEAPGGVLTLVRERFADLASSDLRDSLAATYAFRNNFIAHEKEQLSDRQRAEEGLRLWVHTLRELHEITKREPVRAD